MREIRFRGKRRDTGEWIIGDLLYTKSVLGTITDCRILESYDTGGASWIDGWSQEVDSETVGQFTGLKDKNGVTEIYDGDIMFRQIKNGKGKVIREYKAAVVYVPELAGYYLAHDGSGTMLGSTYEELGEWAVYGEVIGNIWDNPELLSDKK